MKARRINAKRIFAMLLSLFIMIMAVPTSISAAVTRGISLETTLTDGSMMKSSRRTFDVIARLDGKKIPSEVTLNGEEVKPNWDDENKTSYTLKFKKEGENTVVVKASSDKKTEVKTYKITYKKASKGDLIGYTTWTIEGLTIGRDFIIEPTKVPVYEGENSAQVLDRIITQNGLSYENTGKLENAFYLSMIGDGGELKNGCKDKEKSKKLNPPVKIEDKVPSVLKTVLENKRNWPTDEVYDPKALGEFDYTSMSGWMYAVNNVFPNVGFSDSYLVDGDVVRVQFTLFGYGSDIGGGYAMGGQSEDFYTVANKDKLMASIATINSDKNKEELLKKTWVKTAYEEAMKVATKLDATQEVADEVYSKLEKSLKRIPLTKISLNKESITLDKNSEEALSVSYKEENTTDDKAIEWTSSDAKVVTVDNGKITALKPGTADIIAKVGELKATCKVTVPVLSTKPMVNEDKNTGLKLEVPANTLPVDTELVITLVVKSNETIFKQVNTALKDTAEKFKAFDVSLKSEGKNIQPSGKIKVTMNIPKEYDHSRLSVYRILEDGTLKDMNATINDDTVSFETDHFSLYAIVEKAKVSSDNNVEKPNSDDNTDRPNVDNNVEKPNADNNTEKPNVDNNTEKPNTDNNTEKPNVSNNVEKSNIDNNKEVSKGTDTIHSDKNSKELDTKEIPKTQDNSPIILMTVLFFMSLVTLIATVSLKKRKVQ